MNKTLTVALSMCAWVAMVGAGVFASSTSTTTTSVWDNVRQNIVKQFKKFGSGDRLQSETIKVAIEANDYNKLSIGEQKKITKEQFAQMVVMNKIRSAHEIAVLLAVKGNDFVAFQKAQIDFKAMMDTNKSADAAVKEDSRPELTTEQQKTRFDEMVTYYKANGKLPEMKMWMYWHGHNGHEKSDMRMSDTIKAAVAVNDYTKLLTTEQSKITRDQFAKMVSIYTTMQAGKIAIEAAVKNNDFIAFKTAITTQHAAMEANKPADNDIETNDNHPTPTDAQFKTRFDEMVTYYKANGKLPEMKMWMGGKMRTKGMMKWHRDDKDQESEDDSTTK